MKNLQNHLNLLTIISISFALQGCWDGYWGVGGSRSTIYEWKNPEEVIKNHSFESGNMPFNLKSSNLQAPLLSKKGQVNIDGHLGGGSGVAISIATGKKTGLYLKGSWGDKKQSFSGKDSFLLDVKVYEYFYLINSYQIKSLESYSLNNSLKQENVEAGFGIYKAQKKHFRYEYFGGLAYGRSENKFVFSPTNPNLENYNYSFNENRKYLQYFVQGNIGWVDKNVEFIFLTRMSYIDFLSQSYQMDININTTNSNGSVFAIEPAVRFGFGGKTFRLFAQYEFLKTFGNNDVDQFESQFIAGVIFRFSDKISN